MTKKQIEVLEDAVEQVEQEDDWEDFDYLGFMTERLCDMSDRDYKLFLKYIYYERKARKHFGDMSENA